MLPATQRWSLRHDQDFFQRATRVKTPVGLFYYETAPLFQANIITPKNSFHRSIDRHAIKRRLSGELKKLIDAHKVPMVKLVIIANRDLLSQKPATLQETLEKSLSRL